MKVHILLRRREIRKPHREEEPSVMPSSVKWTCQVVKINQMATITQ
jgi:hypothetical protein